MPALACILLFLSCSRDTEIPVSTDVWVRIENATAISFDSTGVGPQVLYGTVLPGAITEYKLIPRPVFVAGCMFRINGQFRYAGDLVCGSPPPPEFEGGYYTYKVTASPAANYYTLEVIKRP